MVVQTAVSPGYVNYIIISIRQSQPSSQVFDLSDVMEVNHLIDIYDMKETKFPGKDVGTKPSPCL